MVSSINSENVVVQGSNQVERFVRSVPDMIAAKAIEFLLRPDHGFINDNNEKLNLLEKIETTSIEVRNNPDNQENAVITYSQDFTIFDHNTNEKSRKPFLMIPISLFKEAQKIICNDLKINANGEVVIKVSHGIQAQNISICSEDFIRIMDRNFINGSLRDMRWLKIPNFERTIEWYNIFTDQCKIIVDGDVVLIGKKGIINNMGIIKAKNIVRRSEGNIVDEATNKTGALYPYNVELQEPPGWLHQISRPITASYEALEDIIVDTPNGEIIEYGTDRIAGNDIIYRAIKTSSLQVFTNELHNQLNHHFKCIPIPKSPILKGRLVKLQTQQSIVTNNIILCDTVEFDGDLELKCGKGLSTTVLTTSQSQKLGGVSVGNTETTIQINEEIVVPTVIKVNNLIGRNEGKLKLEGTIGEICHMYLGKKDLIEKAAYKRTKTYIHQESYGFCLPKINMDPILQAIEGVHAADDDLSKITSYVNTARVLVDTATDAVRLTHLETYSNPITTMVSTLLGRYVSSMGFVAQTTDTVIDRTVAVQSRMKVGVLQADNILTHLEGIWDVDEAHIKTAQFEMVAPENTTDSETHTESFSVMFSPAAMVAGCCTPTIGYAGNSANRHEMTHSPAMFRAKKLFLQCNDAVFSGTQVQSKIVEMLVSGNLTVETLKGMFSEHLENKSFQAALGALPSASGAPESLYKNCIDCISEIVGTERFYLEVGNTLYKKGSFVGLRPEGYVMRNPDDEQIIANRIQEDEVHEEYFHHRPMAIFDTIQATLGLMNSIDEFRQTWNHINSQSSVNAEDIEPEEKEEQDKQNEENAEKLLHSKLNSRS
ncbi:hypothetical protein TVAG_049910 [Trichomonas vaginalis G3]|uniref:Uncharacterized protein n=1 Tax=Trichomonas vaginalis (strain ATCC PRA-98 / G3) TaxID=412133 RepID=A2EVY6_TRIV3|nr:hypothetical protein TVAG_049910 [Trichomonas vaginalis G3]|eukprot:XP_001315430.1 hypothetical protein [Trichomonas vaginalis G3]